MNLLDRIRRWRVESTRTKAWRQASKDWKAKYPLCAVCNITTTLEAHDCLPYHKLTTKRKNDYDWLMTNFITLCHAEHRSLAHANDPDCLMYQPQIRTLAASVQDYQQYWRR